jgi:hypothetical protein
MAEPRLPDAAGSCEPDALGSALAWLPAFDAVETAPGAADGPEPDDEACGAEGFATDVDTRV